MLEIAWKSFLFNYRKRILYYLSVIIAMAEMFVFVAVNNSLTWNTNNLQLKYGIVTEVLLHVGLLVIAMILVICYSLHHYVMERVKDYKVLLLMGVRSARIIRILILEYAIGFLLSVACGVLLGNGLYGALRAVVNQFAGNVMGTQMPDKSVYVTVIGLSVMAMMLVTVIVLIWFGRQDPDEILLWEVKNEPQPAQKMAKIYLVAGTVVLAIAWLSYRYLLVDISVWVGSFALWSVGCWLVAMGGLSLFLKFFEGHTRPFAMNRIYLSQYNQKYKTIMKMAAVFLFLDVYILSLLNARIASYTPVSPEKYPYDVVWMTVEEGMKQGENVAKEYDAKLITIPMIRLSDFCDYEAIGISETGYKKLTGQSIDLNNREILISYQCQQVPCNHESVISRSDFEKAYSGEDEIEPRSFKIGKWTDEPWYGIRYYKEVDEKYLYSIKRVEYNNIVGQLMLDKDAEKIVVFSDELFQDAHEAMENKGDEATELLLFNLPRETYKEALAELSDLQKADCLTDEGPEQQSYFYECSKSGELIFRYRLAIVLCLIGIAFSFLCFKVLLLCLAIVNGRKEYDEKLLILETIGMDEKEEKRLINREYRRPVVIATVFAIISTLVLYSNYRNFLNIQLSYYSAGEGLRWMLCDFTYLGIEALVVGGSICLLRNLHKKASN